jgi:hypothetical protein
MKISIQHMPLVRISLEVQRLESTAGSPGVELPGPDRVVGGGAARDGARAVSRSSLLNLGVEPIVPRNLKEQQFVRRIFTAKERSLCRFSSPAKGT